MARKRKQYPPVFVPPRNAWTVQEFMAATPEEVAAKTVDCATCPVAMMCHANINGSGIVCRQCHSSSVYWVGKEGCPDAEIHALIVDCEKSRFREGIAETKREVQCALCSGTVTKHEMDKQCEPERHPTFHYVYTRFSTWSAEGRQKLWREQYTRWQEHSKRVTEAQGRRQEK